MLRQDTIMALTWQNVADKIDQAKPDLLDRLVFDVGLKAKLHQMGVITDDLKDKMEPVSLTLRQRADLFLDDLRTGPVRRFLHFCRVMHEEGKADVLEALGVDIDYIDNQLGPNVQPPTSSNSTCSRQKRHFYRREEGDEKREIAAHLLPGLLEHCGTLERSLMQVPLFDFSEDILLDLTELYMCTDVSVNQNDRGEKQIEMREFFSKLFQSHVPKSLLLEGEVGNGKSSLLRQYAHSVCKQFLECHNKGPEVPCEGHMWEMVVYTAAGSINSSAEQAISDSLMCNKTLKSQLMNAISQDGNGVLLIKDGMDELRNKESVKSIRKYTKDCQAMVGKPTILLSSRNGLSQIEKVLFDRTLVIKGFSLDQGLKYVEKYFKVRHNLTDHPVLRYIKAHTEEVEWLLTNPLQALIFSELTARGALSVEDVKTLSRVKLLKVFEMHIIRRDRDCRDADRTQECISQFYNSCLECLLKDQRKIRDNDIDIGSPHLAFLNKYTHTDMYANTEVYYMFGHEMFVEFFSIQGLIQSLKSNSPNKQAMLLYLCANSKMRNALLLTCGYIAEFEPGLLDDVVFIIQACLILQAKQQEDEVDEVDEEDEEMNQLTEGLLQLLTVIQETFTPDVLTQGLTTEQAKTAEEVSQRIKRAFNQDAGSLRETAWFIDVLNVRSLFPGRSFSPGPALRFIIGCINEFRPVQQKTIYSLTTHRLLPCVGNVESKFTPGRHLIKYHVYPVGSVRWAALTDTHHSFQSVWCPSDMTAALTQHYQHKHTCDPPTAVAIDMTMYTSLWGAPPPEKLTCEEWVPVLRQLLTHRVQDITIVSEHVTHVDSLLTALQQVITPPHRLTGVITVVFGQVSEEVLVRFCEWTRTVHVRVELGITTVLLSADRDLDYVTHLETGCSGVMYDMFHPTDYVLPNGQTFTYVGELSGGGQWLIRSRPL